MYLWTEGHIFLRLGSTVNGSEVNFSDNVTNVEYLSKIIKFIADVYIE